MTTTDDSKGLERLRKLSKFEDNILDIVYRFNDYTTSDLQGAVQALVLHIYLVGSKDGFDEAVKIYNKVYKVKKEDI